MNLVGLIPARNEDWVLGLSARVALKWCDSIVIQNHASTDGTSSIILDLVQEFPGRVVLDVRPAPDWHEMSHRQAMLAWARANAGEVTAATHIAIIDADEILTGDLLSHIKDVVRALGAGVMLQLPGYNLRSGIDRYHQNGVWGQRWFSVAFKDINTASWKGDKFHAREPDGVSWAPWRPVKQGRGGVMHLWGASERRLIAKHALYQITETLRWPAKDHDTIRREYSQSIYGRPWIGETQKNWAFIDAHPSWWAPYADLMRYLDVDAEPWQEAEVRRLVAEHGHARFAGLDLFGIA